MPIEAEIKACVREPERVWKLMGGRASAESSVYRDVYYDRHDQSFAASGRELRVRTVTAEDSTRTLLTYKDPAVDETSGSKPEHETRIDDVRAVDEILRTLGCEPVISFEKHCVNWNFSVGDRQMLATLVTVPELDGTFIEIETIVDDPDCLPAALDAIRAELNELGITEDDITTELYTEAVKQRRDART